jgi:predicted enzyme related to lactoylglutathione lyase
MANHVVTHVEIASSNPAVAGKFYADLFGWAQLEFPEMDYLMLQPESGATGAVVPLGESYFHFKPETVLVYVSTDDVTASLEKAEKLGGKTVLPSTPIPGTGDIGVFQDPTGNFVGLLRADQQTE